MRLPIPPPPQLYGNLEFTTSLRSREANRKPLLRYRFPAYSIVSQIIPPAGTETLTSTA